LDERPPSFASIAGHDAPLLDERAATRGSSATEGGDERVGVTSRYPSNSIFVAAAEPHRPNGRHERFVLRAPALVARHRSKPERPRRTTRPGTRTLVDDALGRLHRRNDAPLIGERPRRAGVAQRKVAVSSPASVAANAATLIGERPATRGRGAMECGDANEGAKRHYPFERQLANIRCERQDQGHARSSMIYGPTARPCGGSWGAVPPEGWMSVSRPHAAAFIAATTRRSSANAPPRAGVSQRKLATRTHGSPTAYRHRAFGDHLS